jgi:hypothetical protein
MPLPGWIECVGLRGAWSASAALARRISGRAIQITSPQPLGALEDGQELPGGGRSYAVHGTLKHLSPGYEIWLLEEDLGPTRCGHRDSIQCNSIHLPDIGTAEFPTRARTHP